MRIPTTLLTILLTAPLVATADGSAPKSPCPGRVDAFPGAEGHGRCAAGGRGGRVERVTHLGDDGPGSLRAALRAEGPRTVLFDIAGTIELGREIVLKTGRVTVAGHSAPGGGITLKNHGLVIKADDVIVRFLRVRPGSAAGVETDAISVSAGRDVIIDHCSTSWATDETLTVSPSDKNGLRTIDRVTVQWTLVTESLNESVHSKGRHGYGSLVRGSAGARYSFHHNLWAHHQARMPRPGNYVDAATDPEGPLFDFRNNVFYNWGGAASGYNADSESLSRYQFVANYYLRGPDSSKSLAFEESNPFASQHFSGNFMNHEAVGDPWSLVRFEVPPRRRSDAAFEYVPVRTDTAPDAYAQVLDFAGASLARDAVDARVVRHVREGSGRLIDDASEVGGWPQLAAGEAPRDSDGDGLPDEWERGRGLDPADPADGSADPDGDGYTLLEDYLNGRVAHLFPGER